MHNINKLVLVTYRAIKNSAVISEVTDKYSS